MSFTSNPKQLAEKLSELLNTPVSEKVTDKLLPDEFRTICVLMYKNGTEKEINQILTRAKMRIPRERLFNYRNDKQALNNELKKKPFDIFFNFSETELQGGIRQGDYSLRKLIY